MLPLIISYAPPSLSSTNGVMMDQNKKGISSSSGSWHSALATPPPPPKTSSTSPTFTSEFFQLHAWQSWKQIIKAVKYIYVYVYIYFLVQVEWPDNVHLSFHSHTCTVLSHRETNWEYPNYNETATVAVDALQKAAELDPTLMHLINPFLCYQIQACKTEINAKALNPSR